MEWLVTVLAVAVTSYWIIDYIEGSDKWIPVWTKLGEWKLKGTDEFGDPYTYNRYCCYEILKSQKTGKFKMKLSGYLPKYHDGYTEAVEKLNQLSNELREKGNSSIS
jgi:hypothetical protein